MDYTKITLIVLALVGLVKPILERTALPVTSPLHDPVLRVLAVLTSCVAALVVYMATTAPVTSTGFWQAAGGGLLAGLIAIGAYTAAKGNPTPPQP